MACCCAAIREEIESTPGAIFGDPATQGRECHGEVCLPEMAVGVRCACIEFWDAEDACGRLVWSWHVAVFTEPGVLHRSVDDPRLRKVAEEIAERVLEKLGPVA